MQNRCNSNNYISYISNFYSIDNSPNNYSNNVYKNNYYKKWANKASHIQDFHNNENFYHNHDNFYMKNRCNSNNNNSYICNFYRIKNVPSKDNSNVYKHNPNNKWANKTSHIEDFTVTRIYVITILIFTLRTGVILITTTAIIVNFTVLIIFLIRTIIMMT